MIAWTVLLLITIKILYKQDVQIDGKDFFEEKYRALGKMTQKEIKFLVILICLVLAMVFSDIDAGWLFTLAVIACFFPGIEVAKEEDIKKVNFPMVFFVAATMSIGSMSNAVGVAGLVSELVMPLLQNVGNMGLILFAWVTGVAVDLMMTPLAGMAAFTPLFIEIL